MERPIEHDDLLGELVSDHEAYEVQQQVMRFMYQVFQPPPPSTQWQLYSVHFTGFCVSLAREESVTRVCCTADGEPARSATLPRLSACVAG